MTRCYRRVPPCAGRWRHHPGRRHHPRGRNAQPREHARRLGRLFRQDQAKQQMRPRQMQDRGPGQRPADPGHMRPVVDRPQDNSPFSTPEPQDDQRWATKCDRLAGADSHVVPPRGRLNTPPISRCPTMRQDSGVGWSTQRTRIAVSKVMSNLRPHGHSRPQARISHQRPAGEGARQRTVAHQRAGDTLPDPPALLARQTIGAPPGSDSRQRASAAGGLRVPSPRNIIPRCPHPARAG